MLRCEADCPTPLSHGSRAPKANRLPQPRAGWVGQPHTSAGKGSPPPILIRFWLHRCAIHVAGLIDHCVVALGLLVALVGLLGALVGLLSALGLLGARRLRWRGAAVLRWCCCAVVGAPAPRPPQRRPHAAPTPLLWPFLWRGLRRLLRWLRLCPLLGRREGRRLRLLARPQLRLRRLRPRRLLRWLRLRPQEMIRRREEGRLRLLLQ